MLFIVGIGVVALVFTTSLVLVMGRYKRVPPNKVLVIYGNVGGGKGMKVATHGGVFVMPMIQSYAYLSLEPMAVELDLRGVLTSDNIRVNVPATASVAVSSDPRLVERAAERMMGLTDEMIATQARGISIGQMRRVIARTQLEAMIADRERIQLECEHEIEPELDKLGMTLVSLTLGEMSDESGYIKALGDKALVAAKAVGLSGTVERDVPAIGNDLGQVRIRIDGKKAELFDAVTRGDRIGSFQKVRVIGEARVLIVEKA